MQFFHDGNEYTNRFELALLFPNLSHNRLQRLLESSELVKVEYNKKYYFEKATTEVFIATRTAAPELTPAQLAALEAGALDTDEDEGYWL